VDLDVVEGPVPSPWPAAVVRGETLWADPDRMLFRAGGASVHVTADSVTFDTPDSSVRTAMDWLLYATATRGVLGFRGRHNLHATLVATPEGDGVAIVGNAMAGKSTTTIELVRRGWIFCCDDIVEVDTDGDVALAHPIARPVHLSDDAARRFGGDPAVGRPIPDSPKRAYLLDGDLAPRRLVGLVVLSSIAEDGVEHRRVEPLAALPVIAAGADRYGIQQLPEHRAGFLAWGSTVCQQVPVWDLRRPAHDDTVAAVADAVEELIRGR
jgi:hypothetical protein